MKTQHVDHKPSLLRVQTDDVTLLQGFLMMSARGNRDDLELMGRQWKLSLTRSFKMPGEVYEYTAELLEVVEKRPPPGRAAASLGRNPNHLGSALSGSVRDD